MHWTKRLRYHWKHNPRTRGDAPRALPQLVLCPKRVIPVWKQEISGAYPQAEVRVINSYQDIKRWLDDCATSRAPTIIGILSHSKSTNLNIRWTPALIEKSRTVQVLDTNPPDDIFAECETIQDAKGRVIGYTHHGKTLMTEKTTSLFYCPECGTMQTAVPQAYDMPEKIKIRDGVDELEDAAAEEDARIPITDRIWFERNQRHCCNKQCAAPLWQQVRSPARQERHPQMSFKEWAKLTNDLGDIQTPLFPDSFSPYEYLKKFYQGCVALLAVDESHNGRSENTNIGHAFHLAQKASQMHIYASGTHFGGELLGFFFYWFRFNPRFWRNLGIGWKDVNKAIVRYGVVAHVTKEHVSEAGATRGQTTYSTSTRPAPGISSRLLPSLLNDMVFIDVLDVGAAMPPKVEIPITVSMEQPELGEEVEHARNQLEEANEHGTIEEQETAISIHDATLEWARERNLQLAYQKLESRFDYWVKERRNGAATLQQSTLPKWWCVLPFATPEYTLTQTIKGDWGEKLKEEEIIRAPVLAADHIYPLEQQLRETIGEELAQQRSVMIFVDQTKKRSTPLRLQHILSDLHCWVLPDSVDAELRQEKIIQAVNQGHRVIIVPYKLVSEGLNLQMLDTSIWYEMAQNLFLLDQASRRIWRLGSTNEKRIIYMAYEGTPSHKKMLKLGSQSGAAALFAGNTPEGELAKYAGADQTMAARMSAALEGHEEIDLKAAFKRRAKELEEQLQRGREFIGAQDNLAERIAALDEQRAMPAAPQRVEKPTYQPAPGFEQPAFKTIRVKPKRKKGQQQELQETVIVEQYTFFDL